MKDKEDSFVSDNLKPKQSTTFLKFLKSKVFLFLVLIVITIGVGITLTIVLYHPHPKLVTVYSNQETKDLTTAPAVEVLITSTGYLPQAVTIKAGQSVVWQNNDTTLHTVSSDPFPQDNALPGFNSVSSIAPGATYKYAFLTTGVYTYHDDLNPTTFKAEVIVTK